MAVSVMPHKTTYLHAFAYSAYSIMAPPTYTELIRSVFTQGTILNISDFA